MTLITKSQSLEGITKTGLKGSSVKSRRSGFGSWDARKFLSIYGITVSSGFAKSSG